MSGALLLQADVTANNDDDRALLKRFQLFGPPGTIFFDAQGGEVGGGAHHGLPGQRAILETLRAAGL